MTAGAIERLGELANARRLARAPRALPRRHVPNRGRARAIPRPHPPRPHRERSTRVRSSCRAGRSRCAPPRRPGRRSGQPVPPPGFHDLIAMLKVRALRIEGDQHPFMANLRYFKDLLALPRARAGGCPMSQTASRPVRADRRPLPAACHRRQAASPLRRGSRRGHSRCCACTPQAPTAASTARCSTTASS